ncbi:hypothetical protein LZ189_08290 [Rhodovulum sulfidophilum]|nr:hypothetical protein [Rhodovulum sulfidophilum]
MLALSAALQPASNPTQLRRNFLHRTVPPWPLAGGKSQMTTIIEPDNIVYDLEIHTPRQMVFTDAFDEVASDVLLVDGPFLERSEVYGANRI